MRQHILFVGILLLNMVDTFSGRNLLLSEDAVFSEMQKTIDLCYQALKARVEEQQTAVGKVKKSLLPLYPDYVNQPQAQLALSILCMFFPQYITRKELKIFAPGILYNKATTAKHGEELYAKIKKSVDKPELYLSR